MSTVFILTLGKLFKYCSLYVRLSTIFQFLLYVCKQITRLSGHTNVSSKNKKNNHRKFNIRFLGVKIWNSIQDDFKSESHNSFRIVLTDSVLDGYIYTHN